MQHMEVPRLRVESELRPLSYVSATVTLDSRHICDLYHSSWQHWIRKPLSEARDRPPVLMDVSQIHFH